METLFFHHIIDYLAQPGDITSVTAIEIGDGISIANDFELIGYTVGYILDGWEGGTILDRKFFLFESVDSLCNELLEIHGYVHPWNIPKEHLGWISYRWISVRTLLLLLAFEGDEVITVQRQ